MRDQGTELGVYTKAEIIEAMAAEAHRLGVRAGYIAKRRDGISIIKGGTPMRIDIKAGPSAYARGRALAEIRALLEVPT